MEKPLNELIDFDKVGREYIKKFLKFILSDDYYFAYLTKEVPDRLANGMKKIMFADELSIIPSWYRFMKKEEEIFIEKSWKKTVYEILSMDPEAKITNNGNSYEITVKEDKIGMFASVMIPDMLCNRLKFERKNGDVTMFI